MNTNGRGRTYYPLKLPSPPDRYVILDQTLTRRQIEQAFAAFSTEQIVVTPDEITADQNDYPVGKADVLRLSTDASRNLTGFDGGIPGREFILINVGSQDIVIQNQNASSEEENRVITGTGADITVAADDVVRHWYDAVTGRWRVVSHY